MTRTFRVYFRDGNERIFEAKNMYDVIAHICFDEDVCALKIVKIEEVEYYG